LILRSQPVANSSQIISRMGNIAMNAPVEVDRYGHANSTNALGISNGFMGSTDFWRNAKISIMHIPSIRPSKDDPTGISCIVPFPSRVDETGEFTYIAWSSAFICPTHP
ncbi:hypothetical protein GYMLUDRAFT_182910, partial [Collybiopsis luxurians FD-317 M1]